MNRLRMLASSARPLPEVLVDALRRKIDPLSPSRPSRAESDHSDVQLTFPLDDDFDERHEEPQTELRPDVVAAAVLLGRAFDQHRDVLASLLNADAVTIIEVAGVEWVDPVYGLLSHHLVGSDGVVLNADHVAPSETHPVARHTVTVFKPADAPSAKTATKGNLAFANAVQRRCAVIGLATAPDRELPPDLVRLADRRIVVPPLEADAIAAVIAAVTGRHPGPLDAALGRDTTLEHLRIAVRADLGPRRCVERLQRLSAVAENDPTPRLSDLHGLGDAKDWGLNLIRDLRDYRAGRLPWAAVDKGALLSGPPGTGKTSFARALAKEAGLHFVATSYAQWQASKEGHLGHVTAAIRENFADAARHAPAILFIDEIDTLPARGSGQRHDDWWTAIVNVLLESMDGFARRAGVVVLAACNDPSRLDPALVRAGRLDKEVRIPLPNVPSLTGIFRHHLGADLAGVDLIPAAVAARGGTGADVERWVRTARRAARRAQRALTLDDLLAVIRDGVPDLPPELRRRVAYHEAGHAVVRVALGLGQPLTLAIHAGGGLAESTVVELSAETREELERHIACKLAGRASEDLVYGKVTAGAGGGEESDLAVATRIALQIETAVGLGHLGPLWVANDMGPRDLLLFGDLRVAVSKTLETAYGAAKKVLAHNRGALDALATTLFARGYLDRAEIAALLAETTPTLPSPSGVGRPL